MATKYDVSTLSGIIFKDTKANITTELAKLIYNGVTVWERWIKKTGTHTTQSFTFTINGGTVTGSTFSAVKPTKLNINFKVGGRDWVTTISVSIQGLTQSGKWVTLWSGSKSVDGAEEDYYTMNGDVTVNVSEPITQLRSVSDGRMTAHTQTVKIVEWYQKG